MSRPRLRRVAVGAVAIVVSTVAGMIATPWLTGPPPVPYDGPPSPALPQELGWPAPGGGEGASAQAQGDCPVAPVPTPGGLAPSAREQLAQLAASLGVNSRAAQSTVCVCPPAVQDNASLAQTTLQSARSLATLQTFLQTATFIANLAQSHGAHGAFPIGEYMQFDVLPSPNTTFVAGAGGPPATLGTAGQALAWVNQVLYSPANDPNSLVAIAARRNAAVVDAATNAYALATYQRTTATAELVIANQLIQAGNAVTNVREAEVALFASATGAEREAGRLQQMEAMGLELMAARAIAGQGP